MSRRRHFLFATFGSLGDLHPSLAIGIELARRGHRVTLASHPHYRARVEREGLAFADAPPNLEEIGNRAELFRQAMHPTRGSLYILTRLVLPYVAESVRVFDRAAADADVLVSHPITFALPIVAEKRSLPWVGTSLQPVTFLSATDPPLMPMLPRALRLRLGPAFYRALFGLVRRSAGPFMKPVAEARAAAGLPARPLRFEFAFSLHANLALFSRVLQAPQPDWPARTQQTGFAFYDRPETGRELPVDLERFLDAGPPPIVFTLGSSAVYTAGDFYRESAEVARRLGRRAVLLIGDDAKNRPATPLDASAIAVPYASYSKLFPRALAIVHQGGAGTTGQAIRAGKPQLVVPFSHDQPDHAARIARLGLGAILAPAAYRARRVEGVLDRLLGEADFARRAAEAAHVVASEGGAVAAADVLEQVSLR